MSQFATEKASRRSVSPEQKRPRGLGFTCCCNRGATRTHSGASVTYFFGHWDALRALDHGEQLARWFTLVSTADCEVVCVARACCRNELHSYASTKARFVRQRALLPSPEPLDQMEPKPRGFNSWSRSKKHNWERTQRLRIQRAQAGAASAAAQRAAKSGIPHSSASLHGCSQASGCSAGQCSPLPQPSASSSAIDVDTPWTPPRMTAGASKCPIA